MRFYGKSGMMRELSRELWEVFMLKYYQIPCECGRIHEVTKTQAGSSVVCECGESLSIPTMRELKEYPVTERPDPQKKALSLHSASGVRQRRSGLLFVLLVASVLFAGIGVYYFQTCPKEPTVENASSPFEVWQVWQTLRTGIDTPPSRAEMMRTETIKMSWRWIAICGTASALCILGMFGTLVIRINHQINLDHE